MRSIFETDFTSVTLCWARIPDQPRLHFSLKYSQEKQPQTNQGRLKINCTMSLALTFRLQYDPYVKHGEKQHHCTAFRDVSRLHSLFNDGHINPWLLFWPSFPPPVCVSCHSLWFLASCSLQTTNHLIFHIENPFLCLPSLLSKKQKSVSPNCSVT